MIYNDKWTLWDSKKKLEGMMIFLYLLPCWVIILRKPFLKTRNFCLWIKAYSHSWSCHLKMISVKTKGCKIRECITINGSRVVNSTIWSSVERTKILTNIEIVWRKIVVIESLQEHVRNCISLLIERKFRLKFWLYL